MNLHSISNFISDEEKNLVTQWSNTCKAKEEPENSHIKEIHDYLNGFALMCDLSNTDISNIVCKFQGDSTIVDSVPEIIVQIRDKISERLSLNKDHSFVQMISMKKGGIVKAHYDAAAPGYITYKCNLHIHGDADKIYIDNNIIESKPGSLYCFEASLYKHWVGQCKSNRILLSYGFVLPYKDLGWDEDAPRVKMSNRIYKKFQSILK